MNDFKSLTSAELLDIILRGAQAQAVLQGNEQSDEAMYYVLKERVGERLKEKYRKHEHVFFEAFEDVLDDFFLYLREGNGKTWEPYHALRSIVNKDAFEGWLVSTFRNYLLRLDDDHQQMAARIDEDFCSLYPILIHYYNSTLQKLKQEPEITALRQKHYALTGLMLHEEEVEYGKLTVYAFWNKMNRWLLR